MFSVRGAEAIRDESVERLTQGFGGQASEHPLRRLVEKDYTLVIVHGDDCVHRRGDDACQSLFAFAQRLFGMLMVINVHIGTEPLDDLAARIPQRHGPRLEPAVYAVIAANAELDIERRVVGHRLIPGPEDWLAVVGVKLP